MPVTARLSHAAYNPHANAYGPTETQRESLRLAQDEYRQISAGQPALAGGQLNLVEAVRQLMGDAGRRQVKNARNALVTGIGVIPYGRNWGSSSALVLQN